MKKSIVLPLILFFTSIVGFLISIVYESKWSSFFLIYNGVCLGAIFGAYQKIKGFSIQKKLLVKIILVAIISMTSGIILYFSINAFRIQSVFIVNVLGWIYIVCQLRKSSDSSSSNS